MSEAKKHGKRVEEKEAGKSPSFKSKWKEQKLGILGFQGMRQKKMEKNGTTQGSINFKGQVADLSGEVHLLPCAVKYDGPCSVSDYFKPKSTGLEVEGLSVKEAHFRGRKLQGATISIPDGYSGFVVGKKNLGKRKDANSEENLSCWEMNAKFKNITYWNHDNLPSQDDAFLRSFHWLSVAESMHRPVAAEDLVSASIALGKMEEGAKKEKK